MSGGLNTPFVQPMNEEQRRLIEQQAFNFHRHAGRKMQLPPHLFEALKAAGVSTRHMEANEALLYNHEKKDFG